MRHCRPPWPSAAAQASHGFSRPAVDLAHHVPGPEPGIGRQAALDLADQHPLGERIAPQLQRDGGRQVEHHSAIQRMTPLQGLLVARGQGRGRLDRRLRRMDAAAALIGDGHRVARPMGADAIAERGLVIDGLAVDCQHGIALAQPRPVGGRARIDAGHQQALRPVQPDRAGHLAGDRLTGDAQPGPRQSAALNASVSR